MYRHCIFCSANLGANEALDAFPVGRLIAFDGVRGRLWAVCPLCSRWNLAPIAERWEPVEEAERLFRDSRLRVHSENVGLCKLADGTRLVRIGSALPRELAAWRYGDQLTGRRRTYLIGAGVVSLGVPLHLLASATGSAALFGAFGIASIVGLAHVFRSELGRTRGVVHHFPPGEITSGRALTMRRAHLATTTLHPGAGPGELELRVRDAGLPRAFSSDRHLESGLTFVLPDAPARFILRRAAVHMNYRGASARRVDAALDAVAGAGGADSFIRETAASGGTLMHYDANTSGMFDFSQTPTALLALEMALRDEEERRAMDGELALLESAWREAEMIAAIADTLPGATRG